MMKRIPIQIAALDLTLVTLADDGTIWQLFDGKWKQLPRLPRTDEQ